jgi:hypothetical protein
MVQSLTLPSPGKAVVLFDSYYLCPTVPQACAARGFDYVGVAKKNCNFFPDGRDRDKRKLSRYGANVLARDGRAVTVRGKKHRLTERVGRLSKAGPREVGLQSPARRNRVDRLGDRSIALGHENRVEPLSDPLGDRGVFQNVEAVFGTGRLPSLTVLGRGTLPPPPADPSGAFVARCPSRDKNRNERASTAEHPATSGDPLEQRFSAHGKAPSPTQNRPENQGGIQCMYLNSSFHHIKLRE